MVSAVVIIATTGAPEVRTAIESCLALDYPDVSVLAVIDGPEHRDAFLKNTASLESPRLKTLTLTANVGREGFYGHRIYAAFSHLVDEDYVLFLDEDNFYDRDHVSRLVATIERTHADWAYSLRKICDRSGAVLLKDDCESLGRWPSYQGYHLVDTGCYCLPRPVAARIASAWHGGWGQDRVVLDTLMRTFPRFTCSGAYSLNYRLQEPRPPTRHFFLQGNLEMQARYPGGFPWNRES